MKNYDVYNSDDIEQFANTLNSSEEITQAIMEYRKTYAGRIRVWESPTQREIKSIEKRAFAIHDKNTKLEYREDVLYWGNGYSNRK